MNPKVFYPAYHYENFDFLYVSSKETWGFFTIEGKCFHCLNRDLSVVVVVTSSGILKAKQKLGITFNSDKLGGIDFTKISKLTMCSA